MFILRTLAALGILSLFVFASLRLEQRLSAPATAPGWVEARAPAFEYLAAARPQPAALELRVFATAGVEHRGPLRIELQREGGERLQVAFAEAPYRLESLEPGRWRTVLDGPVLATRAADAAFTAGERVRLEFTRRTQRLEDLPPLSPTLSEDASKPAEPVQLPDSEPGDPTAEFG